MKFLTAFATIAAMAALLGLSIWVLVEKGHVFLFLAALGCFSFAFAKLGCLSH
jgi:hypothetical protein